MRDLTSMLAALREEERGAVIRGKANLEEIRSEIVRVEELISHRPSQADQAAADHPALAGPSERRDRELGALRDELAKVKPGDSRKADIEAEIARLDPSGAHPEVSEPSAAHVASAKRLPPGK